MNTFKKTVSGVGTCALIFGGIYAANAQDINGGADLPIYGISASISKAPSLELGGGQFFQVQNKLRLNPDVDTAGVKIMSNNGEEFLLEERDGAIDVGGEVRYSEVYLAHWPEINKYVPVPVVLQGPMNIGHINFGNGSSALDSADRQILSAMADEIEHTGLKAVYMVGRADSVGSYESNLEISRKRVLAAKNYLLNHLAEMGITDVTINTEYMGELASKTKPDSEDRRVDVTIYP
ncbi:MAG: OmpA family protein [Candidatus Nanopelagicaceae bacterium]